MKPLFALLALFIFALPAWGAEAETTPPARPDQAASAVNAVNTETTDDPVALKAQAEQLLHDARALRAAADHEYPNTQAACWKKFLVSRCLDEAGQAYRDQKQQASRMESQARAIERDIKRREIAAKDAKRAAEDARREDAERGKP